VPPTSRLMIYSVHWTSQFMPCPEPQEKIAAAIFFNLYKGGIADHIG